MKQTEFARYIVGLVFDDDYEIDEDKMVLDPESDLDIAKGHTPREYCSNIQAAYDEFFGRRDFQTVPIEGGLNACENRYGNLWRADLGQTVANRISDQKRICKALHKLLSTSENEKEVMNHWDDVFQNCGNGKASSKFNRMKKTLMEKGWIKSKKDEKGEEEED